MKSAQKKFNDGDVIFREGEKSPAAFVIASGQVELFKTAPGGMVRLATLTKGEIFGEMGIIDKAKRSATAVASGAVTLQVITRDEFLERIRVEPEMALRIMAKLSRRLRAMDDRLMELVKPESGGLPIPAAGGGLSGGGDDDSESGGGDRRPGFLDRLLNAFRRRYAPTGAVAISKVKPLVIVVAGFDNDQGDAQRDRVAAAFEGMAGITVRTISRTVEVTLDDVPLVALGQATQQARQILLREEAELLIWGRVDPVGMIDLRFTGAHFIEDERPGMPSPVTRLPLPADFSQEWVPLLLAVSLSAVEPRNEPQVQAVATLLPPAVEQARAIGLNPPGGLEALDQAAMLGCFGNAAAAVGHWAREAGWLEVAVDAYGGAIGLLPRDADAEWGMLHRDIGMVLQTMGERSGSVEYLDQASEAYKAALEAIRRQESPREWASLHNRLGVMIYKVQLMAGNLDSLKPALAALQSALQVFTRVEYPAKWAEIMNNLAQVLQVYGDHARSTEILERAVDACRQALEVRTFDSAPMLWAATENNLGSALFLLAKHSQNRDYLEQAGESFRSALGTYRMLGARRLAEVAEKNLARVDDMLKKGGNLRQVVDPSWAEAPETVGTEDSDWSDEDSEAPQRRAGGGAGRRRRRARPAASVAEE